MKPLILLTILATFSVGTQAATAKIFATDILDYSRSSTCEAALNETNCDFVQPDFQGNAPAVNRAGLTAAVSSNADTAVGSGKKSAWIDLGFGTNQAVTGTGADLVIFSIGNGYRFGLQAFGSNGTMLSNFNYSVPADGSTQAVNSNGNLLFLKNSSSTPIANISATPINLLDASNNTIADNTPISHIRLYIGNDYNGTDLSGKVAHPLFSLAGAFHTSPVPLPLPLLLFSSGLLFLGWVGRRKTL